MGLVSLFWKLFLNYNFMRGDGIKMAITQVNCKCTVTMESEREKKYWKYWIFELNSPIVD